MIAPNANDSRPCPSAVVRILVEARLVSEIGETHPDREGDVEEILEAGPVVMALSGC